jgi:ketosteroid isomerase-like protein
MSEAVRQANQALYRAFESLELARMDEVWAHDGQVTCVHPGWPLAEGWPAVRATWETIFRNTGEIRFEVTDERVDVRGDLAWVVCFERIAGAANVIIATNVLRREADGVWRVIHHHGSAFTPPRRDKPTPPPSPAKSSKPAKLSN